MVLSQHKRNMVILGTMMLIAVLFIFLISPGLFLSPTVTFIETELNKASQNRVPVQTRTDFGKPEVVASFPYQIGKWEGLDYDTTKYIELLGANLILLRGYMPSTFNQPVFFTIVQSETTSSFHPPKVCFSSQGYKVQEEGDEKVTVEDASWLRSTPASTTAVPFKKLVITKSTRDGKLTERRLSLYCYVKDNQFYSDTITLIQTEALAPLQGSYEGSLHEQKTFLAQAVPLLFSPAQAEAQWRPLALALAERGAGGCAVLATLIAVPLGIIIYPNLSNRNQPKD